MSKGLNGRVAFITGAARGQGRAHAVRLAQEGVNIVAVDICGPVNSVGYPLANEGDLEETARLVKAAGAQTHTAIVDVRDYAALSDAADSGSATFGRIDIVCANAGISSLGGIMDMPVSTWRDMIDINLTGVWQTIKAVVPHIIAGGEGGSVVLVSSVAGLRGFPNIAHYTAAKHGLVGLMRALALELAPHRIRVNSLHPTQVDTPMIMNDMTWRSFVPGVEKPTIEQFAAASKAMIPFPTPWMEPEDISEALLFLVSDQARYLTGVALPVDGGATIQ